MKESLRESVKSYKWEQEAIKLSFQVIGGVKSEFQKQTFWIRQALFQIQENKAQFRELEGKSQQVFASIERTQKLAENCKSKIEW